MRGINIIMALYVRDPLSYPVSDSIRKLTSLFCGDNFCCLSYHTVSQQTGKPHFTYNCHKRNLVFFSNPVCRSVDMMSNKRQRTKIIVSNEPVGKEWFIFYTPHCTKHNGYVCRFCPAGSHSS